MLLVSCPVMHGVFSANYLPCWAFAPGADVLFKNWWLQTSGLDRAALAAFHTQTDGVDVELLKIRILVA